MSCTFSRGCVYPVLPGRDICNYHHRHVTHEDLFASKLVVRNLGFEPDPSPTIPHRKPKLLTPEQVEEIRQRRASKPPILIRELAEQYHVSVSLIQSKLNPRRKVA